jgi:hypothetical protein
VAHLGRTEEILMIRMHWAAQALKRSLMLALALQAGAAMANLVNNGSFELSSPSVPNSATINGPTVVPSWSSGYLGGEALVAPRWFGDGCFLCSGVPLATFAGVTVASSPDGGNFVFSDADFLNSALQQTITGLTPSASYQLTFYQALAQAQFLTPGFGTPGPVSARWDVSLGSSPVQSTTTLFANGATNTWAPWALQTMTFTANSSTEVLSFLAVGAGDPPLLMLDGVNLAAVPEPVTAAMMLIGGLVTGGLYRRRQLKALRG